ncbi:MAG: apolipoprotein N-acyltransferase [Nitrospirota bacterium]
MFRDHQSMHLASQERFLFIKNVFNITKSYITAVFTGICLIFIFPRFDISPLAWIALVPLIVSNLISKEINKTFLSGWIAGIVYFGGTVYWITNPINNYGGVPLIPSIAITGLLVFYLAIYVGLFSFTISALHRKIKLPVTFTAPFIWTSLELIRTYLLSGFPWVALGYSQYKSLIFIQIADITGIYGVSFIIVLVNCLIADFIVFQIKKREIPFNPYLPLILAAGYAGIVILTVLIYGYIRLHHEYKTTEELRVALIQGNIEQGIKWDKEYRKAVLEKYIALTKSTVSQDTDLIIWPETATPFYFGTDKEYSEELVSFVKELNTYLFFGSPRIKIFTGKEYFLTNTAYLLSPDGKSIGSYDKIHLVPFGEYVPLKWLFPFLHRIVESMGDFVAGNEYTVFEMPKGKFSTQICFEIIFPGLTRKFVNRGADFLVTITNDAWFGRSSAPYQHFSKAIFRAVENRVPVIRVANTGISGFIDVRGRIIQSSEIFKDGVFTDTIKLSKRKSFYTRYGDVFAYICIVVTVTLIINNILWREKAHGIR